MNNPLESALEDLFRRQVTAIGGMIVKIAPTNRGVPDRLVILPHGGMFLVELKTATGKLSPLQKLFIERAERRGTRVVVLYGADQIKNWVRAHADEHYFQDHPEERPKMGGRPRGPYRKRKGNREAS